MANFGFKTVGLTTLARVKSLVLGDFRRTKSITATVRNAPLKRLLRPVLPGGPLTAELYHTRQAVYSFP